MRKSSSSEDGSSSIAWTELLKRAPRWEIPLKYVLADKKLTMDG